MIHEAQLAVCAGPGHQRTISSGHLRSSPGMLAGFASEGKTRACSANNTSGDDVCGSFFNPFPCLYLAQRLCFPKAADFRLIVS
eukprot:scaffold255467_cov17-Prasinocladus_malaysianus.AAC.1